MLPVFEFFLSINRSISTRSGPPVTSKFLPNAVSLYRFIFCLNCKVCWFRDIKICKWCLILPARTRCIAIIIIFVLNQLNGFTINKSKVIYFIFSVYFLFLVALNKYKNKIWETIFQSSMKTLFFFFFWRDFKEWPFLSRGKTRYVLCVCTKRTYTGTNSLMTFSEILTLAQLQTTAWWKDL